MCTSHGSAAAMAMRRPAVLRAIESLAHGRMVLAVDDKDREDEADLVIAADFATPEALTFMAHTGGGLICVAMTGERLDDLEIGLMVPIHQNTALLQTAFTVSVDVVDGATTGISAFDRALTIQALVAAETKPSDLARPGHIFPLRAHDNGVLGRRGQTEMGVDLTRLAGCTPAAVICELMGSDGNMTRGSDLQQFSREHDLPIVSVEEVVAYRQSMGGNS